MQVPNSTAHYYKRVHSEGTEGWQQAGADGSKGGSGRIILVDFDLGVYILYYLIMIIPELSGTKKRPRPGGDKAVMSDGQAT